MKWACVRSRVRCHNRLVDPHIPAAALREANPAFLEGPLNSQVTLLHTYSQDAFNAWAHTSSGVVLCADLCIPSAWTHTCCRNKLRTNAPSVCYCFLEKPAIKGVSPCLTLNISFIKPPWKVPRLEIWLPPSCLPSSVSICLASILSDFLSPHLSASLNVILRYMLCKQIINDQLSRNWSRTHAAPATISPSLTGSSLHNAVYFEMLLFTLQPLAQTDVFLKTAKPHFMPWNRCVCVSHFFFPIFTDCKLFILKEGERQTVTDWYPLAVDQG